jgi:hypothetical protein
VTRSRWTPLAVLLAVLLVPLAPLAPAGAAAPSSAPSSAPSAAPAAPAAGTPSAPEPAARRGLPTYEQWLADVRTALRGARPYVKQRVADAAPGERLAINFDVDNTVLATHYRPGQAIAPIARFSRFLERQGVAMLFNTARPATQRAKTKAQLQAAGYPISGLCLGTRGLTVPGGKQACRDRFADRGWTLIANVGNNDTDFVGDGYERAFALPNYGGRLG